MAVTARSEPAAAYLWWALLVVPLWIVLILCTHWEPVMRDGWGHRFWHGAHTVDVRTIFDTAREAYAAENPRLGQIATLLAYTPGPYHAIVTPIVELAVFALLTAVALGRIPSVRRADDALVAALITAMMFACVPQIGSILFYRPFTGNYTLGLALNLLWLLPYRLELARPGPRRRWLAPVVCVLGVAAGLCNEHTGVAFLGLGLAAALVVARRAGWRGPDAYRLWMLAGLVGLATGYTLLLIAPGQQLRYAGLAVQAGIVERIVERGVVKNLAVLGALAVALVGMAPLAAIGLIERWRRPPGAGPAARGAERFAPAALALAGVICSVTLLASPKLGPRLYLASVALIGAGLIGLLVRQLRSRWAYRLCAALAAATLIYVGARLVQIHRVIGPLGEIRLERLEHSTPGTSVTVPAYPFGLSRYFLGDDFSSPELVDVIRHAFGLKALLVAPADD